MSPTVSVVGTVFMDCKGFAKNRYKPDTRNIGTIQFVHGGVGRNVAENLANLDVPTFFVSSVDDTAIGKEVLERLQSSQVDSRYLVAAPSQGMGMWLAILDEKGDLAGSISQMPDLAYMEQLIAEKGAEIVETSTHIALELDLNESISKSVLALAKKENKPVYGIPGNLEVIRNHPELIDQLECFIVNNFEADLFFETDFTHASLEQQQQFVSDFVNRRGLRSMVVTLGEKGSIYYDSKSNEVGFQPVFPVKLVDSSGAGDSFFAGTVMGLVRGLSLKEAVVCGTKVAGWTIESAENTRLDLQDKWQADPFFQSLFINK
jgi:pseudouridine kinase